MDITFRQLRYLMALADAGHFGRAAAAVNVSQPALSVQIQALEASLGVQLVERGARRVAFTAAGRDALARARRIESEMREMRQAARWTRGLGGRLRLGVVPTVAPYLLPVALPMLRGRDLALDLGVREAQTAALLEEVSRGDLDAAVIASPAGAEDFATQPLFEDRFLLAGSARQLSGLRAARPRPEAMDPERLLLLDDGHCLADQTLAACALSRAATRVNLGASSLSTLCRLAEEGFGLTFVPELALRVETAAAPRLAAMRFDAPEPRRTVALVRRRLSVDDGWFGELAALLGAAGRAQIGHALAAAPRVDQPAAAPAEEAISQPV